MKKNAKKKLLAKMKEAKSDKSKMTELEKWSIMQEFVDLTIYQPILDNTDPSETDLILYKRILNEWQEQCHEMRLDTDEWNVYNDLVDNINYIDELYRRLGLMQEGMDDLEEE